MSDWPLSKEEQKKRIIRLYDKDVKAANQLLSSGEAELKQAIQALHEELKAARAAAQSRSSAAHREPRATRETREVVTDSCPKRRFEPSSPGSDRASDVTDADAAAEAAARLQHVIVDAAATLASLFGTSSLSSVLVGIAEEAEDGDKEARQRAKSEGSRVVAADIREDRRRRKSRGSLRVSFAESEDADTEARPRRPSIAEPEPSPSNSPREAHFQPAAAAQALKGQPKSCLARRSRRGRAAAASSVPAGVLDFI
ncbi:unnamed protein product [Effrenium voratum]|uniref:Uncharacterized protein n=1 Tax=Effrenium voratum TaxID=2562239 RepID=A0AA36N7A3_9DINO|nr:unnamed protein product [Effrenium voratum]